MGLLNGLSRIERAIFLNISFGVEYTAPQAQSLRTMGAPPTPAVPRSMRLSSFLSRSVFDAELSLNATQS